MLILINNENITIEKITKKKEKKEEREKRVKYRLCRHVRICENDSFHDACRAYSPDGAIGA